MLRETDVPALRRLFHYRDEWARLHAVVRGDGFTPFVSGSTGQPRMHPIYEQMGKLEVQILALEDRFGLSVRQRVTLGASVVDTARSLDEYNAEFEARHAADRDDVDPRLDLATD